MTHAAPAAAAKPIIETQRLRLDKFTLDDAPFIFALLNDSDFIKYIGDRGVRSDADAREYILKGPVASYEKHGFGLFRTALKQDWTPIGMCGLLKRDGLADVDIGFAFLPVYRRQGYGFEAASAVMQYGTTTLGLERIVALTSPDNLVSGKLLEKLGLRFERIIPVSDCGEESKLYT